MIMRAFVFSALSPGNHSQDLEKRFRVLKVVLPMTRFLVSGQPDHYLDGQVDLKWERNRFSMSLRKPPPDEKGIQR